VFAARKLNSKDHMKQQAGEKNNMLEGSAG